jgi:hypothetical protein
LVDEMTSFNLSQFAMCPRLAVRERLIERNLLSARHKAPMKGRSAVAAEFAESLTGPVDDEL